MTEAEQALWVRIRRKQMHGLQFYRQKPVGPYIVDFYCAAAKLVIEIDGGQHFSEQGVRMDMQRDDAIVRMGLRVLRVNNDEVLQNMDGVMAMIEQTVLQSPLTPLLQRGEEECGESSANSLLQRGDQ